MQRDGDHIKTGSCDLPTSSLEGVVVNLRNLGGHAGTSLEKLLSSSLESSFISTVRFRCCGIFHIDFCFNKLHS